MELNVGTTTIVDFLNHSGFDIENKPNAKISDEMYNRLLKEFQRSIDDKQASKSINIGARPKANEPEPTPVRERTEVDLAEKPKEEERPRVQLKRPEVLRKIDLNSRLQSRGREKTEADKPVEAKNPPVSPPPTETQVDVTPSPPQEEIKPAAEAIT
ncbi:MAG: hypothetical protein RL181_1292, partial [Bacteroidota bacterium]